MCPLRPSGSVSQCLWVLLGSRSSKGSLGGGGGRISPKRCVSSMLICHPLNLYCSSTDQSVTLPGRWCCSDRDCHKTCKQKQRKNQEDQRRKQKLLFCTRRLVTLDQFPSRSFSSVYISQCSSSVSASKGMITQATHYYIYQPLQFVFPLLFCASEFQLHFRLLYI